ncbi:MAG: NAD(P)(+) transhydrogenase (Re/Si-specific) subunit beta, partial [Chitinophagales bacterium]
MSNLEILKICYLLGSLSFIVGLKMLSKPDSAKRGNFFAGIGMGVAIFGTIFLHQNGEGESIGNLPWIFGGILIGTVVGYFAAMKVKMTQMP